MFNRSKKVIAVIGVTRADVAAGIAHARTGAGSLPIWAWCAEAAEPLPGCEQFHAPARAWSLLRELTQAWPALSIVSWNGTKKARALKLMPLVVPPFRVVAFNEAHGFFGVRPRSLLNHAGRRMRDSLLALGRGAIDLAGGAWQWLSSLTWRTGERLRDLVNLAWNLLLAILAVAAKPTGPVARTAMKQSVGVLRPIEQPPVAQGNSVIEIVLANRAWPRRRILKALRDSTADFVVFRNPGDARPAEPLIALLRETNSFAVAHQTAWAGWRKVVLHKHPFRVLQPAEVSRVEAPLGSLIAMRRDLLLQFGVPQAWTSGAALMQLCWGAAAAGLRSLAVGDGGVITQEPGMELEDLEFVLRRPKAMTAERRNSRGNVAWSPMHQRPFRGKPCVLVVSPYLPFPLSHGGAVRIYNLCRAMAPKIDFILACFREKGDTVHYDELHRIYRQVYVVDIDEKHSDTTVPAQVAGYRNSAMAALIEDLCRNQNVDLLQLEYTQMAEYRAQAGAVPVVLVEHDITFTLHQQLGNARQARLWLEFEQEALRVVDAVWTMSGRDRTLALELGAKAGSTVAIENGVDLERFRPLPKTSSGPRVLFVGSFRHLPNLLAFKALRETIMPRVWQSCPKATLHVIAGPNPPALADLDPRILIEGFVEDVRPAYRECDVAVVPLAVSAGTNIKLMEAMACGRAVVSTPLGCQGLLLEDDSDLLIREMGPEFSDAVTQLLSGGALRARIGEQARHTAERRFDWNAIARVAMESYASLSDDMMWTSDEKPLSSDAPDDNFAVRAGPAE